MGGVERSVGFRNDPTDLEVRLLSLGFKVLRRDGGTGMDGNHGEAINFFRIGNRRSGIDFAFTTGFDSDPGCGHPIFNDGIEFDPRDFYAQARVLVRKRSPDNLSVLNALTQLLSRYDADAVDRQGFVVYSSFTSQIESYLRKHESHERSRFLHGVYKQLIPGKNGQRAHGLYNDLAERGSSTASLVASFVANQMDKYPHFADHARKLREHYPVRVH